MQLHRTSRTSLTIAGSLALLSACQSTGTPIESAHEMMPTEAEATFEVDGDRAVMTGVICMTTPTRVRALLRDHPGVQTIEMHDVPGSMDDEANLEAARIVRQRGLATHVPAFGVIASGGVDFFLAGARRSLARGAQLGVHSWGDEGFEGADLPRDREEHRLYLDFYDAIEIPAEFYWYTLESAPADGIHWMTDQEIERYSIATEPMEEARSDDDAYGLGSLRTFEAPRGIVRLGHGVHPAISQVFDRYTRVTAPNGKPIHILAQQGWSDDQIVRARKVLEHMLAPAPGSKYGADKRAVANTMANRRATLALFDDEPAMERGFRGTFGGLRLGVQDLRANECPVEGSDDYMRHDTRDAAFEEILHLVHDQGIRPALPEYDREIQAANNAAAERGIWDPWPREEPDSWRNEYIAAAYDNYLDLWTVPPTRYEGEPIPPEEIPAGTSHFGTFRGGSRARLREIDPRGYALIEAFFPPRLTYTPELPADFRGTFSLTRDESLRYTTASQHLRSVTLTGSENASLIGNEHANSLTGNAGDNTLEGCGGDDVLDGSDGYDVAVFSGPRADYVIRHEPDVVIVTGPDGTDAVRECEALRFSDAVYELD